MLWIHARELSLSIFRTRKNNPNTKNDFPCEPRAHNLSRARTKGARNIRINKL
jgi:hypothetical protein